MNTSYYRTVVLLWQKEDCKTRRDVGMDAFIKQITDPLYWWNSAPAIIVVLLILWLGLIVNGFIQWILNNIVQFFAPSMAPAPPQTNPAPSPWQRFWNCFTAIVVLVGLVTAVGVIILTMAGYIEW